MDATRPPEILGLLSDPLRWQLVVELGRGDRRVGELVATIGKAQNLVSYHLRELRRVGLVTARRSSADGRDVYYRADLARCRALLAEAAGDLHPGLAFSKGVRARTDWRLLFLCTGNSARSQIAQALIAHRSRGAVEARSAGSHPKQLHPNAVRVMAARGIDIAGRPSTSLEELAGDRFDWVVTLCDKVREVCPSFPGEPTLAHWSMADPAASGGDDAATYPAFERTAQEIDARAALLLADLGIAHEEGTQHV